MKDKELNEKESLELIARMIRNTRRNLDTGSGNSFLVWGYVGVLVTLAVWAGVTFTGNPVWMWGFWGIPVVGYLLMFLLLRKRQKPVKFYLDKILERVWGVEGQFVDDNTVPVNISRLKGKLGGSYIQNVRGIGYIWTEESFRE